MWIIPSNHPLQSHGSLEFVDSKQDLNLLSGTLESSLMWKSKVSSLQTWSLRWKRVYWIPHLFGRTLKPSQWNSFEAQLQDSQQDILVRHFLWPENEPEQKILDTFGRILDERSKQLDLFGDSSKTSTITSHSGSTLFSQSYEQWVMQLRQEYTQRKKLAHHMRDKDYSSSQWKTPTSSETEGGTIYEKYGDVKYKLRDQVNWPTHLSSRGGYQIQRDGSKVMKLPGAVQKWPTPTTDSVNERKEKYQQGGTSLPLAVKNWPTPTFGGNNNGTMQEWGGSKNPMRKFPTPVSRDFKGQDAPNRQGGTGLPDFISGLQDQENPSTTGNTLELSRGRLNPFWVCQLMGIVFEKTYFVHSVTWQYPHKSESHS